jgi:hypothetical protein
MTIYYKEFRHSPDNIIYINDYALAFIGTGLNDMAINGYLVDPLNFKIQIDTTTTPDSFKWSADGGSTWVATGIVITGGNQLLSNGISIRFAATTGHTIGEYWTLIGSMSAFPLAWFQTEESAYSLPINPPNLTWQWYKPGEFHNLYDGVNEYKLSIPWTAGNLYIANKTTYDVAYAAYLNTPPTLDAAKETASIQLLNYFFTKRNGGVIYSANTYPSDQESYVQLESEFDYSTYLTAVPSGYYVKDINGIHRSLVLSDLQALVPLIEELHYECRLVYDTHYEAIQALTTIYDVQHYNFTTGWPTVPFSP